MNCDWLPYNIIVRLISKSLRDRLLNLNLFKCQARLKTRPKSVLRPPHPSTNVYPLLPGQMDLPTTVEEFICFLDGASVEPYGNQGPTFIGNLKSTIEIALFEALNDAPRGEELKIPIKIFRFLRQQVFRKLQIPHQRTLASELDLLSANIRVIQAACGEWVHGFIQTRLSFSSEETPNLTSESQWWSLLQDLLRDCDKGEAPTQINDIRITEISHELLSCMRLYLDDLKYEEMARQAVKSLTLASVRGMGFQDGIDSGIFQLQDWQKAWEQPFRGRALCALETKLQLNAHAIMNDEKKARMSRIVPVVQASGTGKSRLSEEYGVFSFLC